MEKYLFDIPVYRLTESQYEQNQTEYIKRFVPEYNPNQLFEKLLKGEFNFDESFQAKNYGGSWRYNEIIGYIRIYLFCRNQIRGDYIQTDAKRIVRTRKKQFIKKIEKIVPEVRIRDVSSKKEIHAAIEKCINRCRLSKVLKNRYLDLEYYNLFSNFIEWGNLLESIKSENNEFSGL